VLLVETLRLAKEIALDWSLDVGPNDQWQLVEHVWGRLSYKDFDAHLLAY